MLHCVFQRPLFCSTSTEHVRNGLIGLMKLSSLTDLAENDMAISSNLLAELDVYRGGRYPQNLKLSIGKYIRASRKAGVTWYSLILELSLARQTVKAWSDLVSKAPKLVPVRIPEAVQRTQVTLVSQAGWRLEDVELAATLFRDLAQ